MSSILDLPSMSRRSLLQGLSATAALIVLHPFAAGALQAELVLQ